MLFEPLDPDYKSRVMESFSRQHFMKLIGATLVGVEPGYCEIHLPYKKELSQQHGFFHAGVVGTIADNSGGYAAYSLMPPNASVLTVEYKLNLISPGDGHLLIARGQVVKHGRTLTVCRSEVSVVKKGLQTPCATSLMTLIMLIDKPDEPVESRRVR